ncbi:hypothetical protein CLV68_3180 [Actinokineospora cianjurensis]|uniref:Uncharacterized protein n=1 Tax=Actinokineospora cianjurensis TaxID=585224 RepID=A0A421B2Z8_9PSEU|nr:hypothetical protein CLV68_3180 [Actinokineospora cianjurensis]
MPAGVRAPFYVEISDGVVADYSSERGSDTGTASSTPPTGT